MQPEIQQIRDEDILQAFEEPYEARSSGQHKTVITILSQAFSSLSRDEIRVISLFVKVLPSNPEAKENLLLNSIIIQKNVNSMLESLQLETEEQMQNLDLCKVTLYVSFKDLSRIKNIRNVQEEIKFLQGNKYCKQMFKKTLFNIIRNIEIVPYRFGQSVYEQNEEIPDGNAAVYLVRSGQFCFKRSLENQPPILLYQFGSGTIFGDEEPYFKGRARELSVSCRSSKGILFKFSQDFFNSYVHKQCQLLLRMNKIKIKSFLTDRMRETQVNRQKNSLFMGQTLRRPVNVETTLLTAPKLSNSRTLQHSYSTQRMKVPQKLPQINVREPQLPKSNSKAELVKMVNPQYQEEALIMNKKIKVERMRSIKCTNQGKGRGEVLLHLIKNSWNFQKNKKKNNYY